MLKIEPAEPRNSVKKITSLDFFERAAFDVHFHRQEIRGIQLPRSSQLDKAR